MTGSGNILAFHPSQKDFNVWLTEAVDNAFKRRNMEVPAEFKNSKGSLQYYRRDLFHRKHLGEKTEEFFVDFAATGSVTNWNSATLGANEIYAVMGMKVQQASGVVGAAAADLDFGDIALNEIQNGIVNVKFSGAKVFEDMPVSAFLDDENTSGILLFPDVELITANNKPEVGFKFNASPGDYWIDTRLISFRIGVAIR